MRKVKCYECGKTYDYDEDGFCPNCGAFNQPARSAAIAADGSVIRVDGLNERNHKGSFVHRELHEENRERKAKGLSKGTTRRLIKTTVPNDHTPKQERRTKKGSPIVWIVLAIIAFNVLANLLGLLVGL